jgi:hypothetical protein
MFAFFIRLLQYLGIHSEADCDDGVLHVPSKQILLGTYRKSSGKEEAALIAQYADGVNVSWHLPCQSLTPDASVSSCYPGSPLQRSDVCTAQESKLCFRGIHDWIVSDSEIASALRMGDFLILTGGDHFDIHYDVSHLDRRIPSVLEKLRLLLKETYNVENLRPVAFRVHTVGPMDGYGVNYYRAAASALNRTVRY